jgi:hypothetical protein
MNAIFKPLAAVALPFVVLFVLATHSPAQEAKSKEKVEKYSPVGTWNWERKVGDSMIPSQLTIEEKGGKFSGKLKDKDNDLEIKNSTLKDGTFSFEVFPHAEHPDVAIKFSGKLSADKITGRMNYDVNGEAKSVDWVAKRDDPFKAVLGKWFLEFETPDGQGVSFTMEVKKKGKGLDVTFLDDDTAKIKKVKFKKGVLSFDTKQLYQDQPLTVEWDLTIKGNIVTGLLFYSFDNNTAQQGELDVDGERVK